jgi:hypothetical protein
VYIDVRGQIGAAVTLLKICIRKVPILNLECNTGCPYWGFCGFPQTLQANVGLEPWLDHDFSFQYLSNSSLISAHMILCCVASIEFLVFFFILSLSLGNGYADSDIIFFSSPRFSCCVLVCNILWRFVDMTNNNGVLYWMIGFIDHSFIITRIHNNLQ